MNLVCKRGCDDPQFMARIVRKTWYEVVVNKKGEEIDILDCEMAEDIQPYSMYEWSEFECCNCGEGIDFVPQINEGE